MKLLVFTVSCLVALAHTCIMPFHDFEQNLFSMDLPTIRSMLPAQLAAIPPHQATSLLMSMAKKAIRRGDVEMLMMVLQEGGCGSGLGERRMNEVHRRAAETGMGWVVMQMCGPPSRCVFRPKNFGSSGYSSTIGPHRHHRHGCNYGSMGMPRFGSQSRWFSSNGWFYFIIIAILVLLFVGVLFL